MKPIPIFVVFSIFAVHTCLTLSTTEARNERDPNLSMGDDVPIPAETDPEIARLVEIMNQPEPWDHL